MSGPIDRKIQVITQKFKGNAHHLHFEIWKNNKPIDPVAYFQSRRISFEYVKSHA